MEQLGQADMDHAQRQVNFGKKCVCFFVIHSGPTLCKAIDCNFILSENEIFFSKVMCKLNCIYKQYKIDNLGNIVKMKEK